MMDPKDIAYFKKGLEDEKAQLLEELSHLGRTNPEDPNDWEATYGDVKHEIGASETEQEADENDLADEIEGYEARKATLSALEGRLYNVRKSLQKIAEGRFGICIVKDPKPHPIERDRLEVNAAARTCKAHMNR